jgi:hypothetical protein
MEIAMNVIPRVLLAVLLAGTVSAACADEIYRSLMPNGDVVYGESPFPGAKSVKKVQAPPSGVVIVTPGDKVLAGQIPTQRGGVSIVQQKPRAPIDRVAPGGGATYGTGAGPLPKPAEY